MCLGCNLPLRHFLSLAFPSPVAAMSCVVTGDGFVCSLAGRVKTFSGLVLHHSNAGKMTKLGAMKWSLLTLLSTFVVAFGPFIFLKEEMKTSLFLPPFPWQFPFCQSQGLS